MKREVGAAAQTCVSSPALDARCAQQLDKSQLGRFIAGRPDPRHCVRALRDGHVVRHKRLCPRATACVDRGFGHLIEHVLDDEFKTGRFHSIERSKEGQPPNVLLPFANELPPGN